MLDQQPLASGEEIAAADKPMLLHNLEVLHALTDKLRAARIKVCS